MHLLITVVAVAFVSVPPAEAWNWTIPVLVCNKLGALNTIMFQRVTNVLEAAIQSSYDEGVIPSGDVVRAELRKVEFSSAASTGIDSSPTWTGVYQILSHEPNAYASNWNLWMPDFLGVYRPIPGADFTNGFHGFPTRGGSQLLWTNSLGTRVTYGCILLSNDNIALLYDWAEEGVVVEITG